MKDQKKSLVINKYFICDLVIDESLNKYDKPEFIPEKLEKVKKKFSRRGLL